MKKKRRSTHAEGVDDSEDYRASKGSQASEGSCILRVSLISKRVCFLETLILKVFLFRFRFK
jgi:hypothetical protein